MAIVCFDEKLLPPPTPEQFVQLDRWLGEFWDVDVDLPAAWKAHVTRWHGGAPRVRCFRDPNGRVRAVCRMFNLRSHRDGAPGVGLTSWYWERDVSLDYSIREAFNAAPFSEQLAKYLVPIAGLDYCGHDPRGMTIFSLLCFDITKPRDGIPIVTWAPGGATRIVRVADSFEQLDAMVTDALPDPCAEPPTPDWTDDGG